MSDQSNENRSGKDTATLRSVGEIAFGDPIVFCQPGFKEWFDGSVVVDGAGQPRKLYHGTATSFETFENDGCRGIFYFTTDPIEAFEAYAERELYNQISTGNDDAAPVVYPVYLKVDRLFDPDNSEHRATAGLDEDHLTTWDWMEGDTARTIRAAGFDGMLVHETEGSAFDYAVFSPDQILNSIQAHSTLISDKQAISDMRTRLDELSKQTTMRNKRSSRP